MGESRTDSVPKHNHADSTHSTQTPQQAAVEHAAPILAPGLFVGAADDAAEHRADELADRALSRLAGSAELTDSSRPHHHSVDCGHIHRSSVPAQTATGSIGAAGGQLDSDSSAQISALKGSGKALDGTLRRHMETAFGTSFSSVRIHDDAKAARLASSMSAHAFTTGQDIFFGAGQFQPDTETGRRILAHELGHVVSESGSNIHRGMWGKFKAFVTRKDYVPSDREVVKDMRKNEKEELEQARTAGIEGRKELLKKVQEGGDPLQGNTPAERFKHLSKLLSEALKEETQALESLTALHFDENAQKWKSGWSDERAADEAYEQIYLKGAQASTLKHIAPPRRNEQERLVQKVRQLRTAANVRVSMQEIESGKKLAKSDLNAHYDGIATELLTTANQAADSAAAAAQQSGTPSSQDVKKARDDAYRDVLVKQRTAIADKHRASVSGKKLGEKLPPSASKLEERYIDAAIQRHMIRGSGPASPQEGKPLEDKIDRVGEFFDSVGTPLSMISDFTGNRLAPKDPESSTGLEVESAPDELMEFDNPVSDFVDSTISAVDRHRKRHKSTPELNYRRDKDIAEDLPNVAQRATSGISTSISILSTLKDGVSQAIRSIKAIKEAIKAKRTEKSLIALKASTDGLNTFLTAAKQTSDLATTIDPGVKDAVAKVIPGFDIAAATLSLVGSAAELGNAHQRVKESNETIVTASSRGLTDDSGKKKIDVMVYPMTKVAHSHSIQLEQKAWDTGKSAADLVTSISSLASGGGFGIPKAIQAGVALVDTIHSLGHTVAKELRTATAKRTEKESKRHLEGSAERVLEGSPAMAVEGIIVRAAIHHDEIARAFLTNYWVEDDRAVDLLDDVKLPTDAQPNTNEDTFFKIRDAVLETMADSAEPEHIWEQYKSMYGKFKQVNKLREQRNELDQNKPGTGKKRTILWNLKMMLRSEEKHSRSMFKTTANYDEFLESKPKDQKQSQVSGPVIMVCGDQKISANASEEEIRKFCDALEKMSEDELNSAINDPQNTDEVREFLRSVLAAKVTNQGASVTP